MANYLTPAGAHKLSAELKRLLHEDRPKIVAEVAEAAAQGDRSENAEYTYGKKKLREIDRRVRFLTKRLESTIVVDPAEQGGDTVRFGAQVEVEDEDGVVRTYRLVGSDEADPAAGCLSYSSPVGRALMRRRVGDAVVVQRPAGEVELTIVSVRFEPAAGG